MQPYLLSFSFLSWIKFRVEYKDTLATIAIGERIQQYHHHIVVFDQIRKKLISILSPYYTTIWKILQWATCISFSFFFTEQKANLLSFQNLKLKFIIHSLLANRSPIAYWCNVEIFRPFFLQKIMEKVRN